MDKLNEKYTKQCKICTEVKMSNRLKNEKSPYLRQHAENPVDWYPWENEAFERAKSEDKPIFLSIGYSTCHWCHVMAHESFEDNEVADILNRSFISIKVDREERPDIDAVYMTVCQAMTGSGGWPLTVIMTPEQKPFFAATYLPKKGRFGQVGLTELLNYVSDLWENEKTKLLESAEKITETVTGIDEAQRRRTPTRSVNGYGDLKKSKGFVASGGADADSDSGDFGKELLKKAYMSFTERFDKKYGGFGAAPKFPSPHNLVFLMNYAQREKVPDALRIALATLDSMAAGGIFDHIGGGFSRYSTDEKWLAPHFEKMLYDNALLLSAYVKAYQLTQDEHYADIARRTADYMIRELRNPSGGFYCAQDADSEGVEGRYYVFDLDEILAVLGGKDGREFCEIYDITEKGNFEGKNIPNLISNPRDGLRMGDPALKKLCDYRKKRAPLHTDDKVLTSWTALAASAFAQAGIVLADESYLQAAIYAVRFIEENMTDARGRLLLRWHSSEAAHDGQLSDYAAYALALINLYRATLKPEYLRQAIGRAEQITELFADESGGGFFQSAFDSEQLISRPKDTYDGAIPSGNSMTAMVFEELAELTGEIYWRNQADKQHEFTASYAEISPADFSFAMTAFMKRLYPQQELICAANAIPEELESFMRSAGSDNTSILFKSSQNAELLAMCAPLTESYPVPEKDTDAIWYLCKNGACNAPSENFYELEL